MNCPRCNRDMILECLRCGWIVPEARGEWQLLDDGTVRIIDNDSETTA